MRLAAMSHLTIARISIAVALVALGTLIGGGIVWARGTGSPVSACVEPRTGYLVYGRSCGGQTLTWDQEGPAGPQGPPGPQGAAGPKGDAGQVTELPSAVESQLKQSISAAAAPAAGKPNLAKLKKVLAGSGASGVWAFSAFHDDAVSFDDTPELGKWTTVAHLDLPDGRYVIVAKGVVGPKGLIGSAAVVCMLTAGVDSDTATATTWGTLGATVVHRFKKAGRVDLQCIGFDAILEQIKVTAIRVDLLKNAYVPAG